MKEFVLAIDPGNTQSGICLLDAHSYLPLYHAKMDNNAFLRHVSEFAMVGEFLLTENNFDFCIEMVASYGMPVGREVFDTCVWIGRFAQFFSEDFGVRANYIYRQEEKLAICHAPKANDATIRHALVDRFTPGAPNYGKGTKKEPGWFYGFAADQWQAYAIGVTYLDKRGGRF